MSERLEELLKESQLDQLDMVTLAVDPGPRTNPDMLVALQVPRNSYAASLPPSVVYRWVDKSLPDLDFNVEQQMMRGSPLAPKCGGLGPSTTCSSPVSMPCKLHAWRTSCAISTRLFFGER